MLPPSGQIHVFFQVYTVSLSSKYTSKHVTPLAQTAESIRLVNFVLQGSVQIYCLMNFSQLRCEGIKRSLWRFQCNIYCKFTVFMIHMKSESVRKQSWFWQKNELSVLSPVWILLHKTGLLFQTSVYLIILAIVLPVGKYTVRSWILFLLQWTRNLSLFRQRLSCYCKHLKSNAGKQHGWEKIFNIFIWPLL